MSTFVFCAVTPFGIVRGYQSFGITYCFHFQSVTAQKTNIDTLSNVVVEWIKLLLRIREVPDSNLSQENGYPE
jgi:hypothetical protein